ncbi:hypothetical protein BDP27DRAFT_1365547 [Rhodocollybia butyracea]|uniref:Uncharacterized protein n=1 Tax=Rhodocollybia butyracea TaxID=206335 RepID=A0A9P5U685_9AGAR|nr:hypothetical protein BDP27DRAFT_1365547 [Rhodocollybia butyracea]
MDPDNPSFEPAVDPSDRATSLVRDVVEDFAQISLPQDSFLPPKASDYPESQESTSINVDIEEVSAIVQAQPEETDADNVTPKQKMLGASRTKPEEARTSLYVSFFVDNSLQEITSAPAAQWRTVFIPDELAAGLGFLLFLRCFSGQCPIILPPRLTNHQPSESGTFVASGESDWKLKPAPLSPRRIKERMKQRTKLDQSTQTFVEEALVNIPAEYRKLHHQSMQTDAGLGEPGQVDDSASQLSEGLGKNNQDLEQRQMSTADIEYPRVLRQGRSQGLSSQLSHLLFFVGMFAYMMVCARLMSNFRTMYQGQLSVATVGFFVPTVLIFGLIQFSARTEALNPHNQRLQCPASEGDKAFALSERSLLRNQAFERVIWPQLLKVGIWKEEEVEAGRCKKRLEEGGSFIGRRNGYYQKRGETVKLAKGISA